MEPEVAKDAEFGAVVCGFVQGMESQQEVALVGEGAGAGAHGWQETAVAEGLDVEPELVPVPGQHLNALGGCSRPAVPVLALG
jgi:hypothetical protein